MTVVTVQERRGPDAFDFVRADWDALHAASAELSPFLTWEWLSAWRHHFAAGRAIRVLVARENGQAIGALALVDEQVRLAGIGTPVTRLTFLGAHHAGPDYLDVLARAGREHAAAVALFDHLGQNGEFDVCDLEGLASDSASVPILARQFGEAADYGYAISPLHVCPRILLDARWPEVLARSKRADNFKRRLRQVGSRAGFEWRESRAPSDVSAAFERFLTLHERRWVDQGGSDAMGRASARAFHREAVPALATAGKIRFEELWIEGACRASIYGLDGDGTYAFYQCGFDPDWSGYSVGLVALGLSIEAAIGRGMHAYDFLHGVEPYKFDWTSTVRETTAVRLVRRSLSTRILVALEQAHATARELAHSLLPETAVERIRRLRRVREGRG